MFLSRNKLWAAIHALLFDKFGDLRDGSTSLKPGVRVHSAVFPLARAKRLQRTAVALERPGCNRASVLGRQSPPATLNSTTAGASRPWGASNGGEPNLRIHSVVFPALARVTPAADSRSRDSVPWLQSCRPFWVARSPPGTLNTGHGQVRRGRGAHPRRRSRYPTSTRLCSRSSMRPSSPMRWRSGLPTASGISNPVTPCASWLAPYIHGTLSGTPGVRCPLGVFPGKGVWRPTTAPRSRQCGPPPSGPGSGRGATKPLGSTHPVTADSFAVRVAHPPGSFSPHAILSSAAVPFSPGCAYAAGGRHRAPAAGGALALRNIESGHGGVCSLAAYPRSLFPGARLLGACSAPGSGTVLAATRAPAVGAARLPGHRIRPCQVRRCRLRHLGSFLARWR
jgi:hypothetical protein